MPNSSQKFLGLVNRRERWGLSWRGWLAVALVVVLAGWGSLVSVYPFLAVTRRVDAQVLVVEGWVPEFAIHAAAEEFRAGGYERIYTTGGPVKGSVSYTNDYNTAASLGADRLRKTGIPGSSVQMVPSRIMSRDRTYSSAIALRDWLRDRRVPVANINVLTEAVHARRTRLLYEAAFGKGVAIGIISIQSPDYDPAHWWRYSEGVREVIGESIAYLYARFLFMPAE